MSGIVVIEFSEMVKVAKVTAEMLDTKPKREIMASAESFVLGKATGMDKVELHVLRGQQELWSKRLRIHLDDALARRDGGRSPATLSIVDV